MGWIRFSKGFNGGDGFYGFIVGFIVNRIGLFIGFCGFLL